MSVIVRLLYLIYVRANRRPPSWKNTSNWTVIHYGKLIVGILGSIGSVEPWILITQHVTCHIHHIYHIFTIYTWLYTVHELMKSRPTSTTSNTKKRPDTYFCSRTCSPSQPSRHGPLLHSYTLGHASSAIPACNLPQLPILYQRAVNHIRAESSLMKTLTPPLQLKIRLLGVRYSKGSTACHEST